MSNLALQFVPEVDPRELTPAQRAQAARAGTLPPLSQQDLARAQEADKQALNNMGVQTETSIVDQFGSGLNTGLARFAGFPVDMATMAINGATQGINRVAGTDIPAIENPIGGSQVVIDGMAQHTPLVSQMPPQNAAQRYARRGGEEIGFGLPAAALTGGTSTVMGKAAQASPGAYFASSIAGDTGAAIAGQTAREIAPESHTADILASMAGGIGAGALAASVTRSQPPIRTREDLQREIDAAYAQTQGAELTPDAQQALTDRLWARLELEGGDALSHRKAHNQISRIEKNPRQDVYGVEQGRRQISKYVARNADEAPMGMSLMDEIDDYLKSLGPDDLMTGPHRNGPSPQEAVEALHRGRRLAHQGFKYDEVANAQEMAQIAAEQGQNKVTATQREIGNIFKGEVDARKAHKSGGYTPDELAAMQEVARPGAGQRALRTVGQMSPTNGALPSLLTGGMGISGATAAFASGNPWLYATVAPPFAGAVANQTAARAQGQKVKGLLEVILEGGAKPKRAGSEAVHAAIVNQLLNPVQ